MQKWVATSFFSPTKLSDEDLKLVFNSIGEYYNFEVLDAVAITEAILGDEDCPPDLSGDGTTPVSVIQGILEAKLKANKIAQEEAEAANSTGDAPNAPDSLEACKEDLEKRINAFCELLKGVTKFLDLMRDLPSMVAGFSEFALQQGMQLLMSQLKIKAYYDFYLLRYLFTGDLIGNNPDRQDILTADMSLAYNILHNNYYLLAAPGQSSTNKNWNVYGPHFDNKYQTEVVYNDSFNNEFVADIWGLITLWGKSALLGDSL